MDTKVLVSVIVSMVAAIISLLVASINWRSTRTLEQVKRTYDLHSQDLGRLLGINSILEKESVPSILRLEKLIAIPDKNERDAAFQLILDDEISPSYARLKALFLSNRDLFDDVALKEIEDADRGSDEWNGIELIFGKMGVSKAICRTVLEQIQRKRNNLTGKRASHG